jgi:hypothetical protein
LPLRRGWQKLEGWFIHLLHLDDSAHRIALGVAIGIFVAFTPTWGIQMLLVVGISWLVRANKAAGVPVVWITNPATNVPVYSFCYVVGRAMVGGPSLGEFIDRFGVLMKGGDGWSSALKDMAGLAWDIALPLWVGTCVIGLVAGVIVYVMLFYAITWYRRRGHHPAAGGEASGGATRAGARAPDAAESGEP